MRVCALPLGSHSLWTQHRPRTWSLAAKGPQTQTRPSEAAQAMDINMGSGGSTDYTHHIHMNPGDKTQLLHGSSEVIIQRIGHSVKEAINFRKQFK